MRIKKLLMPAAIAVPAIISAYPTSADEFPLQFITKASLATKHLDFEQEANVSYFVSENNFLASSDVLSAQYVEDQDYTADLLTAEITFSTIYNRAYLAITVEDTIADDTMDKETSQFGFITDHQTSATSGFRRSADEDTDINRFDLSVTAGYRLSDNINLFGGYKFGETTADENVMYPENSTFEEDGLYIGSSYVFRIADYGSLSFSVAFADMSMNQETETNSNPDDSIKIRQLNYDGDATGLSLAIAWGGAIGGNWQYGVSLKQHNYQYNADGSAIFDTTVYEQSIEDVQTQAHPNQVIDLDFTGAINVSDIETEMSITSLYASLTYIF